MNRVLVIAEAGVNHNGSPEMALRLVDAAASAGADMVKFQTFRASDMVSSSAPKAGYQKNSTGAAESQLEMIRKLELDLDAHLKLIEQCRKRGIRFLSSPFDHRSADLLTDTLGLDTVKIASGEITNGPLLLHVGRKGCRIMLSTGMSTLGEIEEGLGVLAFGLLEGKTPPSREAFRNAFASREGQKALMEKLILLHCTTEYPAPLEEVSLNAMNTMRQAFGLPVGYSDHTEGIAVSVAAAAMGACVIEKHFTLDRDLPGPDHRASLDPGELAEMIRSVRQVEKALGSSLKIPGPSERKNLVPARKSLVAKRPINRGELLTEENMACKRPGCGLSPMEFWDMLGRRAARDHKIDEVLEI